MGTAQSVGSGYPSMRFDPQHLAKKLSMVAPVTNLSTKEVEPGGSQGQPSHISEFKVSVRSCLKKTTRNKAGWRAGSVSSSTPHQMYGTSAPGDPAPSSGFCKCCTHTHRHTQKQKRTKVVSDLHTHTYTHAPAHTHDCVHVFRLASL